MVSISNSKTTSYSLWGLIHSGLFPVSMAQASEIASEVYRKVGGGGPLYCSAFMTKHIGETLILLSWFL